MKKTIITTIVGAALTCAASAQFVTNGDFSNITGLSLDNSSIWPGLYTGVPVGWSSSSSIDVLQTSYQNDPAGFGATYIDVHDTDSSSSLWQDVGGLVAGQLYSVSYDWGNWASNDPYDMTISMGAGSSSHAGSGLVLAQGDAFEFIAGSTTETLNVTFNHTNGDSNTGFNTTNFVVTAVPEPSSTALLGLGALSLVFRRKR